MSNIVSTVLTFMFIVLIAWPFFQIYKESKLPHNTKPVSTQTIDDWSMKCRGEMSSTLRCDKGECNIEYYCPEWGVK